MNASELLEESISDKALKNLRQRKEIERYHERVNVIIEMARVAIPCVLRSAEAGNVRCIEVAKELLELQSKLK